MKFYATGFILPKGDHAESECEDTYWYDHIEKLRFAVADTAANSSYSGNWASMLVTDYVNSGGGNLGERLKSLQERWHHDIKWDKLPYYMEEKARRGDYSTLIGVSFFPGGTHDQGNWEAMAVGDSCLFQVRRDVLIQRFPIQQSNNFNDRPCLIGSTAKYGGTPLSEIQIMRGDYKVNDLFLLATDAAAAWFLHSFENGAKPWADVERWETAKEFTEFIICRRESRLIRDDDVTFLRINLKNTELMVI